MLLAGLDGPQLRHRYLVPILSRLPHRLLVAGHRLWKIDHDPSDGWSLWFTASYHRWVRHDRRKG